MVTSLLAGLQYKLVAVLINTCYKYQATLALAGLCSCLENKT